MLSLFFIPDHACDRPDHNQGKNRQNKDISGICHYPGNHRLSPFCLYTDLDNSIGILIFTNN